MINPDLKNVIKGWDRNSIASKIANDLPHASYVNLGIGMPELVSQHIKEDREIIYHSENGLLGMGPTPNENEIDLDLIGLMCIPPANIDPEGYFEEMNKLNKSLDLSELSMGMSSDFLIAAKHYSTFVRVGSGIFGQRF